VRDYYEILEAHPKASFETIEKCYRIQMKKYHPDVNRASDASERATQINQAYRVLSDPEKREAYDREYYRMEFETVKPLQKRVRFRPFFWWSVMLVFFLADTLYQFYVTKPAPISPVIFTLFLLYTAVRDSKRAFVIRVAWAIGVYVLWLALQGLATMAVWRFGIRLPLALALVVVSQCPPLWFVMRRSSLFTETVYY